MLRMGNAADVMSKCNAHFMDECLCMRFFGYYRHNAENLEPSSKTTTIAIARSYAIILANMVCALYCS